MMFIKTGSIGDIGVLRKQNKSSITWQSFVAGLTETQVLDIDFGQTDRHFQDATGITLADDAGEAIGLALDDALWGGLSYAAMLAAQPEIVSNGTFDSATTSWSATQVTLSVVSQELLMTAIGGVSGGAYQAISTTAGRRYKVAATIRNGTAVSTLFRLSDGTQVGGTGDILSTASSPVSQVFAALSSSTTIFARIGSAGAGSTGYADSISVRKIPGNHGVQTTTNSRGQRQAGGVCRYDNFDDNHLTMFLSQNGPMTLYVRALTQATLSALQVLMGASGSGANRIWIGVDMSGHLCAGVGNQNNTTIVGTTDVRGKMIDACLSIDSTTVKLYLRVDNVVTEEYSGTQVGTPTTTIPLRVAALNNNGTAGSFAGIDAAFFRAAHKFMTLTDFAAISSIN